MIVPLLVSRENLVANGIQRSGRNRVSANTWRRDNDEATGWVGLNNRPCLCEPLQTCVHESEWA